MQCPLYEVQAIDSLSKQYTTQPLTLTLAEDITSYVLDQRCEES